MVNGSSRTTFVPFPGWLKTSTVPLNFSAVSRTMSIPIPRPDISLMAFAVLNPERKIREMISWSSSR